MRGRGGKPAVVASVNQAISLRIVNSGSAMRSVETPGFPWIRPLKHFPIADQPAARSSIEKCFSFLRLSHFLAENRYPPFREMLQPGAIGIVARGQCGLATASIPHPLTMQDRAGRLASTKKFMAMGRVKPIFTGV
jgi:hypothetical protein